MDITQWGPDHYQAAAAVAGLAVAVIVACFAGYQVVEARHLRDEQARPYVIVDFEFRNIFAHIAISNIGATPAKQVRITFDKPLQTVSTRPVDINDIAAFTAPIPMIAPGRKMSVRWDSVPDIYKDGSVPTSYTATVTYLDHRGKQQEEEYVLDLAPYFHTTTPESGLPEIASTLKAIRTDLHNVVSNGHVQVKSSDLDVDRRREAREARLYRGKQEWREGGLRRWSRWRLNEVLFTYGWK
jgi:hypothetical protein